MKKLLFLIFVILPIFGWSQDRVKFLAAGVTCSTCSKAIHSNLSNDETLKSSEPNLETQEWNLVYEKNMFNLEKLKKDVENAGFSLSKVWLNDKLVYEKLKKRKNGN